MPQSVLLSREPSYTSGLKMYFNSVEDTVSALFHMDISLSTLLSSSVSSSFLSSLPTHSWETWIREGLCVGTVETDERGRGWYTRSTEAFSSVRHFIP